MAEPSRDIDAQTAAATATTPPRLVPAVDGLQYYDVEIWLFVEVSARFNREGSLGAFDFFSIVIWKANRAKSVTAKRLMRFGRDRGLDHLEAICRVITREVSTARTDMDRLDVLVSGWGFLLPMASALLTVLYPTRFTVYDYRVCDELGEFHELASLTNTGRLWDRYSSFVQCVKAAANDETLRDKDRRLTGQSMSRQLLQHIEEWSAG